MPRPPLALRVKFRNDMPPPVTFTRRAKVVRFVMAVPFDRSGKVRTTNVFSALLDCVFCNATDKLNGVPSVAFVIVPLVRFIRDFVTPSEGEDVDTVNSAFVVALP